MPGSDSVWSTLGRKVELDNLSIVFIFVFVFQKIMTTRNNFVSLKTGICTSRMKKLNKLKWKKTNKYLKGKWNSNLKMRFVYKLDILLNVKFSRNKYWLSLEKKQNYNVSDSDFTKFTWMIFAANKVKNQVE